MITDRSSRLARLVLLHTYARPMASPSERKFIDRFIRPTGAKPDRHGNWIATIGAKPRVLWSCHTDTVHRRSGRQHVLVRDDRWLHLPAGSRSNCLGADDTAGIFILLEMMQRGIEGRYVFHYGEERGAIGSSALVEEYPEWLPEIDLAIALDRRGTTDVITHQGGRTASDAFALELATTIGMGYEPSDRGIFTDTERYAGVVPECTNLSVGYEHAHSPDEILDADHVFALSDRLCEVGSLIATIGATRDPLAPDHDEFSWLDRYEDFPSDAVRDDQRSPYLDADFDAVTQYDQRNLWDQEPARDREDRLQRELEAWFRDIAARSRYSK